jgi:hypothetical protein
MANSSASLKSRLRRRDGRDGRQRVRRRPQPRPRPRALAISSTVSDGRLPNTARRRLCTRTSRTRHSFGQSQSAVRLMACAHAGTTEARGNRRRCPRPHTQASITARRSLSRSHPDVRAGDDERLHRSGNRPSSCMGWGCRRERQRADAERVEGMRPAARGPANSVLCVSRALDRFESRTWKSQLACRPQPRPTGASTQ